MAGALTHLLTAVACLIIVQLLHFKWEYSWAIFVGNFIPDIVKVVFGGVKQGTFYLINILNNDSYLTISKITSDYTAWFSVGFFFFGLTLLLYHFHFIKKKKMEEYDELYVFFLIGIIVHLVLDALIAESYLLL